jgi:hypothetical protein
MLLFNARLPRRVTVGEFVRIACFMAAALVAFTRPAAASTITVGLISFDEVVPGAPGTPGINGFTIYNFTGSNSQPGTPDSSISFLNTSITWDSGANTDVVGTVDPGSVQFPSLQFPDSQLITDALFQATLSTTTFTISGQTYLAASDAVTVDLLPSTPPDLQAGVDFALIDIEASPTVTATPEPGSVWLLFGSLALLAPALRLLKRV